MRLHGRLSPCLLVREVLLRILRGIRSSCKELMHGCCSCVAVFSPENSNAPYATENAVNCCERCAFSAKVSRGGASINQVYRWGMSCLLPVIS